MVCPNKDMQCIKIVTQSIAVDSLEKKVLTEEYRCDVTNTCDNTVDQKCSLYTVS